MTRLVPTGLLAEHTPPRDYQTAELDRLRARGRLALRRYRPTLILDDGELVAVAITVDAHRAIEQLLAEIERDQELCEADEARAEREEERERLALLTGAARRVL